MTTVKEMTRTRLSYFGYSGLESPVGVMPKCTCTVANLMPCVRPFAGCSPVGFTLRLVPGPERPNVFSIADEELLGELQ